MGDLRAAAQAYLDAENEPAYSWVYEGQRERRGEPNREKDRMARIDAARDRLRAALAVLPVDRVEIRNGHGAARVERIVIAHAETVLGEPVKAIGSVEGTLESVTVRGGREFSVYDPLTQRRIECTFGHRIPVSAIGAAVERRVRVFGEIRYRPTGEIVSVRADEIEVQPPPDQLPTADEVRGILS